MRVPGGLRRVPNVSRGRSVQTGMKKLLFAFAPFALVTLAVVAVRAAQDKDQTERISQTVKLAAGGTLHLKSFSGRVNIKGGDVNGSGNDVVIDAVRHASRERLDHVKLDIHTEGSTVSVDANHRDSIWWQARDNVVDTDFDIKVPRRTNIDISVFSAAVQIQDVEGTHRVTGFSSRLGLDGVTGPIRAHTFSGPVEIQARGWGDDQVLDVETFSGNVTLHVPDTARGLITFRSFSGHLDSDVPLTIRDSSRRSMTADLGSKTEGHSGALRFKTFSGNVKVTAS